MTAADAFHAAIAAELGAAPDVIEPGRLIRFSTNGKRGDAAGWAKLFEDGRAGVFGDWRSGFAGTWTAKPRALMTATERAELARQVAQAAAEREAEQRRRWAENAGHITELWAQCLPVSAGDPVALYLAHRLRLSDAPPCWHPPQCLRHHPALAYWNEGTRVGIWPAMVAPLVAPDGRVVALHRTWITDDGAKAPTPGPVKKLTGTAGPLAGACIRLADLAGGRIGIAEGIETALAARCASGVPTVAAYSAGNLAAWQWPHGLRRLVIFGDADPAGREAAEKLRQRARVAGLAADVLLPSTAGADWCDQWAARPEGASA